MALHRDIYWVGRQWAVTGHGLQVIDQKRKGSFDIDITRLWEDGLLESMHAEEWLNTPDFDKALSVARARYPAPSGRAAPAMVAAPPVVVVAQPDSTAAKAEPEHVAQPLPAKFAMRFEGCRARFLQPWRVRVRWRLK